MDLSHPSASQRRPCQSYQDQCPHRGHRHQWTVFSITEQTGAWGFGPDAESLDKAQANAHRLGLVLGNTIGSIGRACCVVAVQGDPQTQRFTLTVAVDGSRRIADTGAPTGAYIVGTFLDALNNDPITREMMRANNIAPMRFAREIASAEERAHLELAQKIRAAMIEATGLQDPTGDTPLMIPSSAIRALAHANEQRDRSRSVPDAMPEEEL